MNTFMWKTAPGTYRIQTDEPSIARKLTRRKKCNLVAWGINTYLRIFEIANLRADNARRMARHIVTQETEKTAVT